MVLMDLNMPIMDGITAAKKIQGKVKKGKIPTVPVVALTAAQLSFEEERELCQDGCFDMCQMKPINRVDFLLLLHKYAIYH